MVNKAIFVVEEKLNEAQKNKTRFVGLDAKGNDYCGIAIAQDRDSNTYLTFFYHLFDSGVVIKNKIYAPSSIFAHKTFNRRVRNFWEQAALEKSLT